MSKFVIIERGPLGDLCFAEQTNARAILQADCLAALHRCAWTLSGNTIRVHASEWYASQTQPKKEKVRMMRLLPIALVPLLVAAAPAPQPKLPGQQCASGWYQSGSYCVPMRDTKCWSFRKTSGQCPANTIQSGSYCLQMNCDRTR
jgi:hypothetical protein